MNTGQHQSHNYSNVLILSACLLLLLSFGYRSGFGLFVKPISAANGWGREVISVALAVQTLCWGIVAVFAGGLADRFGNAKVIVAGTLVYALGMLLMSGVDNPLMLNVSAGLLVGAGVAGTSFGIVLPAMARAVGEERRQWALGLGTAVGSFGQFAVVPAAQFLIDAFGWMTALNILAASALSMALLAMPLAPYSGKQEAAHVTVPVANDHPKIGLEIAGRLIPRQNILDFSNAVQLRTVESVFVRGVYNSSQTVMIAGCVAFEFQRPLWLGSGEVSRLAD